MNAQIKQSSRLTAMLLYIVVIMATCYLLYGSAIPPMNEKGMWFFASLIMILLGNLLITPYYTKPVDAISYSTAAVITMLSVLPAINTYNTGFEIHLWFAVTVYLCFCLLLGFVCIALHQSRYKLLRNVSSLSYVWVGNLSSPLIIFTLILLFSLVVFHRNDPKEYITISVLWMFISLKPIEAVFTAFSQAKIILFRNKVIQKFGEVIGHENPGIIIIKQNTNNSLPNGSYVLTRSERGVSCVAMVLDYIGFSNGRWVRTIYLQDCTEFGTNDVSDGSSYLIEDITKISQAIGDSNASDLVGIVTEETRINRILIEIFRNDIKLVQGRIVSIKINGEEVYCQITNGVIADDVLRNKDKRSFIIASARKLGTWDSKRRMFNTVHWVPLPNEKAYLIDEKTDRYDHDAIGHVPHTDFHVYADTDALVSHNTAIIGILGVGKSCLSLELIERMFQEGTKAICFDLTDQYQSALSPYISPKNEEQNTLLDDVGKKGKELCTQNVDEGGSINQFRDEVERQLRDFLEGENTHLCRIMNPARFEVWRQDSKPFSGKASMAMLTACEITRIVTECTLKILQESGMTSKAKCCLIYEEAHSLIPEWNSIACDGDRTATSGTAKAILQGRKYGLGCMLITQRTANVTKTILNQCNTIFAMRVYDATGMEFLKNYIGDDYVGVLSDLPDRHAVVFGRGISCKEPVMLKLNDREKFLSEARKQECEESL